MNRSLGVLRCNAHNGTRGPVHRSRLAGSYRLRLFFLCLAVVLFPSCGKKENRPGHLQTALVVKVRDGDTIELADGRAVRYIGIDTPEVGEPGADSATAFDMRLVLGRRVRLEYGHEKYDRYQRTLAWVFVDGRMVNMELLKAGWARCYFFRGNMKYADQMVLAQRQAMDARRGLWAAPREETERVYIGSYNGFRFHRPDCESVTRIKPGNEVRFPTRDSAFRAGFSSCRRCRP